MASDDRIPDIAQYEDLTPRVTEVFNDAEIEVFVGDEVASIGDAVVCQPSGEEETVARIVRHTGNRRAIARLLSPRREIQEGCPVTPRPGEQARVPLPQGNALDLRQASFTHTAGMSLEVEPPGLMELEPNRAVLPVGIEAIDVLSPLVAYGLNLFIDLAPTQRVFTDLASRLITAHSDIASLAVVAPIKGRDGSLDELETTYTVRCPSGDHGIFLGLRAASVWAKELAEQHEHLIVIATLPPLTTRTDLTDGMASRSGHESEVSDVLSVLGTALASTRAGKITALLDLGVDASAIGVDEVIETLALGDVDAQLVMEADGRYGPMRSHSKAPLDEETAQRARKVRAELGRALKQSDHAAIFGEDELEDDAGDLREEAARWRPNLREML